MLLTTNAAWSMLINYIIDVHFTQTLTVCFLWNKHIDFDFNIELPSQTPHAFLVIQRLNLSESFEQDVYSFEALEAKFKRRTLAYDNLVMKLTAAIEQAYCEAIVAFQEDIPVFVKAFRKSVRYAARRLRRVKFLFAFYKETQSDLDYFDDVLFVEQPNILIVEAASKNSTKFELKTNKFVGSMHSHPEQLISLGFYDAVLQEFTSNFQIFADKTKNLQGREVTMATFDYRPIAVLDYDLKPQFYDHSEDNPQHSVYVDGTEIQTLIHFCWLYNCTIEVIVAEKGDWGMVYPNNTGTGLMGMTIDGSAEIAFAALYALDPDYIEVADFLGRSGVTCLVPRPVRKSSWAMLLRPFQLPLWLGVLFYLVVEILALFGVRQAEFTLKEPKENTAWLENLRFGYTTTLRLLVSQGSNYVVSTPALRVLLLACFMIDIVIESVYNGGLASILTIPTMTEAADTVERLARHNLIWVATSDYWTDSIATETNPYIHTIYKNFHAYTFEEMQSFAKYKDMGFAVERLINGYFGNGGFLTPQALNRLKLMQEDIYFSYTMPFVTRLWPLLEKYNHLISIWHSAGFIKYWEWKSVADFVGVSQQELVKSSSDTEVDDGPVKLGMDNFAGLILVWVLGIIVSMICFAFELICHRRSENFLVDN